MNNETYRKPKRFFENSGTVDPQRSYYVPLENVTNKRNQDIKTMVDQGRYFSIFAPRQSGKSTFLEETCSILHKENNYIVIMLSFQKYKELDKTRFYRQIEEKLYPQLLNRLQEVKCEKLEVIERFLQVHHLSDHITFGSFFEELNRIIEHKKIIVFIDEFDGIPRSELENFLNTVRDFYLGYKKAKKKALYSIGLAGIRNIAKLVVGGVSPFNIADQVELPSFSLDNIRDLYGQYTEETGQPFSPAAICKIYEETAGQPWLVNRLGTILTVDVKPGTNWEIDEKDVEKAINILLNERNDHFDNLYEKAKQYKETFIEIVFDHFEYDPDNEELTWLEQFGLVKKNNGQAIVANYIYRARYTKAFFKEAKAYEDIPPREYELPGGRLDMENILLDFAQYIAQIGINAFYREQKPYEKTGQFLLTAWLYRFVRGGAGELHFELHTGVGRMDVLLYYKGIKYIIETKLNLQNLKRTIDQGVKQLAKKYLASENVLEGYLVIFDIFTPLGSLIEPHLHQVGEKKITAFTIGIKRED